MNQRVLKDALGMLGLILLIVAFFILLSNPALGWGLVLFAVLLVVYSLYTERLPHL